MKIEPKKISRFKKIVLISFSILLFVLFNNQIIKGDYYSQRARNNYVRAIPLPSLRGLILDRRGEILAKDRAAFNIAVIPYQIRGQKDYLFKKIAEDLGINKAVIQRTYNRNLKFFFSPTNIITDVGKEEALGLKEKYPKTLLINPVPQRFYPLALEFAHLIGYVQKASSLQRDLKQYGYTPLERVGVYGLEQYYDSYLKGRDGGDLVEVDARGNAVGFLGRKKPVKGKDISLTVDSRFQQIAQEVLYEKKGALILLDSSTGEIIALYSWPSFDLNIFIQSKSLEQIYQDKDSPLINRATQGSFPIGSLMKPILAVAGFEENKIEAETTFDCEGQLFLGNARFRCSRIHGSQNIYQALANSCNIYFYKLGLRLGSETMVKWVKKFGLDTKTQIDLPYERQSFIPTPEWKREVLGQSWYAGDTVNFSIGQGYLQVTPLAITMAINAIANGGYLVEPKLLLQVEDLPQTPAVIKTLGVSKNTLDRVRKGLYQTVNHSSGTARVLKDLSLDISGKTGTAQTGTKPHAWFIGFFPFQEPKYTLGVFLENGGSSSEALEVAYRFLAEAKKQSLFNQK